MEEKEEEKKRRGAGDADSGSDGDGGPALAETEETGAKKVATEETEVGAKSAGLLGKGALSLSGGLGTRAGGGQGWGGGEPASMGCRGGGRWRRGVN